MMTMMTIRYLHSG